VTRPPTRQLALVLEAVGVLLVLGALARLSPWLALGVAGVVLVIAAQFLDELV